MQIIVFILILLMVLPGFRATAELTLPTETVEPICSGKSAESEFPHFVTNSLVITNSNSDFHTRGYDPRTCALLWVNENQGPVLTRLDSESDIVILATLGSGSPITDALTGADKRPSRVDALNASTGEVIWSKNLSFAVSDVWVQSEIFVAAGSRGVARLDGTSGDVLWQQSLDANRGVEIASAGPEFTLIHAPQKRGETYISVVLALKSDSGLVSWKREHRPLYTNDLHIDPDNRESFTIVEDTYDETNESTGEASVQMISLRTGILKWKFTFSGVVNVSAINGIIVVTQYDVSESTLTGLSQESGEVLWTRNAFGFAFGRDAAGSDLVIEYSTFRENYATTNLELVDPASGIAIWSTEVPGRAVDGFWYPFSDQFDDRLVYVQTDRLVVVDAISGEIRSDASFPNDSTYAEFNGCDPISPELPTPFLLKDFVVLSCGHGFITMAA